jgi:DNA gyrase subunit A
MPIAIEEEMERSYLDYAMSVIVSRALPDVRDGLKPVHRRIIFAMHESGYVYDRPFRKSARIVGDVMGKYHPHGDTAIYDALVRMAQDFAMRLPLIAGQGNFGSMDGDRAAAMRYTEARLARVAHALIDDIDKDTVDFRSNYDDSAREPTVLPARYPNLLVNGAGGIAVGMATNIPPHNPVEVCNALLRLLKNREARVGTLCNDILGPDFPTGGQILTSHEDIVEIYRSGHGTIRLRGTVSPGPKQRGAKVLIIDAIPYGTNKATLV